MSDEEEKGGKSWPTWFIACIIIAALAVWAHGVRAHDRWSDGSPVPDWVKSFCCGPADVHHYRYDDVKITPAGFVLPDYPDAIPAKKALPSEDGDYWAFFATYSDGSKSAIYCFFAPPSSN